MILKSLATTVVVLALSAAPAWSASVVAYGVTTVQTGTAPTLEGALQNTLQNCSAADRHCEVVTKCAARGYGAAVASTIGGVIESVGAACGRDSSDEARDAALQFCQKYASRGTCTVRALFRD